MWTSHSIASMGRGRALRKAARVFSGAGGEVTGGKHENVSHVAATPLGQQVRAIAELIEIDGRRLVFKVEAYDEKRKIGEGQHERFVVHLERFTKRIGE